MDRRSAAAWWLILQGAGGLVWWVLLLADTVVRDWYFADEAAWQAGRTLVFADVVLFGFGSIVAGWMSLADHRFARLARWFTVGAVAYATLVAAGWVLEPIDDWLGLLGMAPALVLTVFAVGVLDSEGASVDGDR